MRNPWKVLFLGHGEPGRKAYNSSRTQTPVPVPGIAAWLVEGGTGTNIPHVRE